MELSERLKTLRLSHNMTQQQFANQIGIIIETYQKYESGSRQPGKKSIENLAKNLNVSVSYLLGETENLNEEKFIRTFRELSEQQQVEVLNHIEQLKKNNS